MVKVPNPPWTPCHHPHLAQAINTVPPEPAPAAAVVVVHHALLFGRWHGMLMEAPTPSTTAIAGQANTSPLTMVNAAPATDKLGNVSPAGSTGTMQFSDNAGSESGEEQKCRTSAASKLSLSRSPRRRHKVSVLPEEYDASSGHTPPGFEGTWRETNARCGTARPLVPGHISSPRVPPGPFYVDTPPSKK